MTIASQIEGAGPGGFLMSPRHDNRRAFRAAMRHSRLVRVTRVGLPLAIIVAATAFGVYRWLDPVSGLARLPVSAEGMVISGTKIVMRQPRLTGFTKDERPYTLIARSATKDVTNPDALELEGIQTSIIMPDGRRVEVAAREGFYDGKAERLRLKHDIVVSSADYEVSLREALVNVKAGTVVSEQPVEVKMVQGTVTARRFSLAESGAIIRFEGDVTMVIDGASVPIIAGPAR